MDLDLLKNLSWLVLFLPLAAAVTIALLTKCHKELSAKLSIGAIACSFLLCVPIFLTFQPFEVSVTWLSVGDLNVPFGLKFDMLSTLMLLVVTGVGTAIHVYSYGYMHDDPAFSRYFASLSLFTFSMLGIVLSNNLLQMFIFWELVGVSSYLLIGFWHARPSAADACKKAFLTNRVGDFGFILGILMVWGHYGSLHFDDLFSLVRNNPALIGTTAGLLLFCGAVGKSAQFPLHVWLPDAMEGPTPVSALIHAATMVAAGVFMLCRVFFLLNVPGSYALEVIAWVGGVTSLLAALMAVQQNDIKRILAYSTLSQLGYMVMAVGLRGPDAAMFHLTTHACFKALLFLGAGSIIHALHHEQDIWKMGGLRKKMPTTYVTFMIGTLALCGVWPLSGFFSKDAVLATAAEHNPLLFGIGILVAVLTAFYMSRLVIVALFGPSRSDAADHAHESPGIMTVPLRVLAMLSVIVGFVGLDKFYDIAMSPADSGETHPFSINTALFGSFEHSPLAAFLGLFAVVVGVSGAYALYWGAKHDPLPEKLGALARAMRNRFYFDEVYDWFIARTQDALATVADWFDRWIIAGLLVRGVSGFTEILGRGLRMAQTGNLQTYAFLFVLGTAIVLFFVIGH